jgi:thiol-disulfide isomerase/thioredoxin
VRHSLRALPTVELPRADGKATLVWFGATWCDVCKAMEGVVSDLKTDMQARLAVVEKDVDTEPGLARQFYVRGTPTFVVLDADGHELGRVPPSYKTRTFELDVERVLARSG